MIKKFFETPGWEYRVDEISASVYCVLARDDVGRTVQRVGLDPEALLEECKADVLAILKDIS